MMVLDVMDELHSLLITLDRQIVQENWKQAYAVIRRLELRLNMLSDEVYMHLVEEGQLEPVEEEL